MKASDLMVGDWYRWYADGKYYYYQVKAEDFTKDYVANFEPIPLTPEILELNGWGRRIGEMGDKYYEFKNYDCTIYYFFEYHTINLRSGRQSVFIENKRYVHELQHALKMCGLNELADNILINKE